MNTAIKQAYAYCRAMAAHHYENFPVASFFLPRKMRDPICAIYAFARTADDFADEGVLSPPIRLEKLSELEQNLRLLEQAKTPVDPIFVALADAIETHQLPIQYFYDLLKAFKQDVLKNRYETFEAVLAYCRCSANSVGRLLLILSKQNDPHKMHLSDHICTALQLINFFQDLHFDLLKRNRCYLPQAELTAAGLKIDDFLAKKDNPAMRDFLCMQLVRVEQTFKKGFPLGQALSGRFGLEIRLILQSANIILKKLLNRENIYARPMIKKHHWFAILWRAVYA